jgi:hypothetical protein
MDGPAYPRPFYSTNKSCTLGLGSIQYELVRLAETLLGSRGEVVFDDWRDGLSLGVVFGVWRKAEEQ